MKKFITVLQFELTNYFKNKTYLMSTIFLAVLLGLLMFLPSIFDLSALLGTNNQQTKIQEETVSSEKSGDNDTKGTYVIFDKNQVIKDSTLLQSFFPNIHWEYAKDEEEVKKLVNSEQAAGGFVVNSLKDYVYYVENKSLSDSRKSMFDQFLLTLNKQIYCEENNINFEEIDKVFNLPIESVTTVLGKDMGQSYWYCYALVIIVFMVIIFYGTMIATSITSEKSNRSIEVLVTSADSNSLMFGKVIAGAIASIFQVGVILGSILGSYQLNADAWGHMLDSVLKVPGDVLLIFALFGIGGYLFYAFIYGAVGALVSKTEDISKSSSGIQMIIMLVYFAVLFQLYNIDGIVIKVASFLPISSYSAMFARAAMGEVSLWEIIVSFLILVVSTIGTGMLGAKIYRMGTLRYGNPIKLTKALKGLKEK